MKTKTYNLMFNIGRAKYVVNSHDGEKTHPDGSPFYDIAIFGNKIKRNSYIKELESSGFKPA